MERRKKNIVIRTPNWIGDAILSIPAIEAVASVANRLCVIAHQRTSEIFKNLPYVTDALPFSNRKDLVKISKGLHKERYDIGVVFPFSFSSAFFIYLCGVKERIGYLNEHRGLFLSKKLKLSDAYRERHLVNTYIDLARILNPKIVSIIPHIIPPENIHFSDILHPWVGIAPGATYGPAKRWALKNFALVGDELTRRYKAKVFIFGGYEEKEIALKMNECMEEDPINLVGKVPLIEAASIMKQCDLFICNDTGIMHLAAAVGTPTIAIFGSTNPKWTGPLGKNHKVIKIELDCSPCYERTCRNHTCECLKSIGVEEVMTCVKNYI